MILKPAWVLCALLGSIALASRADASVVTLCVEDTQPPSPGSSATNLAMALQLGGTISFACGGPATIRFKTTHFVRTDTRIDGGGTITLDGGHNRFGMLLGDSDTAILTVSNLRVVNAGGPPPRPQPGVITSIGRATGEFVGGHLKFVETQAIVVEQSWFPIFLNSGAIVVIGSSFSDNDGSVVSGSSIEILSSHFSGNRGSPVESFQARTPGPTSLHIDHSDFTANTEPVRAIDGTARIYGAKFTANRSVGDGGALVLNSANATIEESQFTNNTAVNGGAIFVKGATSAVSLRSVRLNGNVAKDSGGAIALERTQVRLELTMGHVTFQDNAANFGGAVSLQRDFRNNAFLNGGAVAFVRNHAGNSGGAVFAPNASMQLSRGVFLGNSAGSTGGAIAALQQGPGATALANSLVVRNSAPQGAAFWGNSARFVNTTIADNSGVAVSPQPVPIGPLLPGAGPTFPIRFSNSILSGTLSAACGAAGTVTPYLDEGNNLQFPGSSCGATIRSAYPFLGPYYVPFFFSPVLRAGNEAICDAVPINGKDLYNARRPLGQAVCAIGAVEGDIAHLGTPQEREISVR